MHKKNITYKISTYPSQYYAWQQKNKDQAEIKMYISSIYKDVKNHSTFIFNDFVYFFIYYMLVERVCLEYAFNNVRIKGGRCSPYKRSPCKAEYIAHKIFDSLKKDKEDDKEK